MIQEMNMTVVEDGCLPDCCFFARWTQVLSCQQISGALLDDTSWPRLSDPPPSYNSRCKTDAAHLSPTSSDLGRDSNFHPSPRRHHHSNAASLLQQSSAGLPTPSILSSPLQALDRSLLSSSEKAEFSKQSPLCSPTSEPPSLPTFDVFRDTRTAQESDSLDYDNHFLTGLLRPLQLPAERSLTGDVNVRGERIYSCMFCPYNSTRSDTLKVHIRTHTGEKPYYCNICPYRCNQRSQLSRHIASKHGV